MLDEICRYLDMPARARTRVVHAGVRALSGCQKMAPVHLCRSACGIYLQISSNIHSPAAPVHVNH